MADANLNLRVGVDADTSKLKKELSEAARTVSGFGRALEGAFQNAAFSGRSLEDVVRGLGQELAELALRNSIRPLGKFLETGLGNVLDASLFGGAAAGVPVTPFARGGVLASPSFLPLGSRGLGLAGERGPEAVLPLRRGADGRLGVSADHGQRPVSVTVNVQATDADSFRRSEAQVAASLNRAVSRGLRNL